MSHGADSAKVLLIASDTIGSNMAGTGIRYWNLARVIGQNQAVTLATPSQARPGSSARRQARLVRRD